MKNYGAPSTAHRHDYLLFIGVGTVGDDHVNTGTGGNFGGGQLGGHAAGAKAAVGAAAQLLNFGVTLSLPGGSAWLPGEYAGRR